MTVASNRNIFFTQYLHRLSGEGAGIFILSVIAVLMVIFAFRPPPLYVSNQNTYYPHGLHSGDHDFLADDWFVTETRQPHIVFTFLIALMKRFGVVNQGSTLILGLLHLSFYLAIYLIGSSLLSSWLGKQSRFLVYLGFLVLVAAQRGVFNSVLDQLSPTVSTYWGRFWNSNGMGGQYIYGGYLQPSEFGILILLAIALLLRNYWKISLILLIVATYFHFSYAIHSGFIVLVAAFWNFHQGFKRSALLILAVFAVTMLPITLYSLSFTVDPLRSDANEILALHRQPHHAVPGYWWGNLLAGTNTLKLFMIGLAAVIVTVSRQTFLSMIIALGFIYTVLGVLVVHFSDSASLGLLYPWRGSTLLIPLSQAVICSYVVYVFHTRLRKEAKPIATVAFKSLSIILLSLLTFRLALGFFNHHVHSGPFISDEASLILDLGLPEQSRILVPVDWQHFRLESGHAIYVDWKSHPFIGTEVVEWWRRINTAQEFYEADDIKRSIICASEPFDYYFIQQDGIRGESTNIVASTSDYHLVSC